MFVAGAGAVITIILMLSQDCGVGLELAMETSSRALITSLVYSHIFSVMNFQVHSIIFHMVSSRPCACE